MIFSPFFLVAVAVIMSTTAFAQNLTLTFPGRGSMFRAGSTRTITWTRKSLPNDVYLAIIEYSLNGGMSFSPIANVTQVPVPGVDKYNYKWVLPQNLVVGSAIFNATIRISDQRFAALSEPFTIEPFSTDWALVRGTWYGQEKKTKGVACEILTCSDIYVHITDTELRQTYPPNSACGEGTTVIPLSLASFNSTYAISDTVSGNNGQCSRVQFYPAVADSNGREIRPPQLVWYHLNASTACPAYQAQPSMTAPADTEFGCASGKVASYSTFTFDSNPALRLYGSWTGTTNFAIPVSADFGSCALGACSSTLEIDPTAVSLTWPSQCGAGSGTKTAVFDPKLYDGVFYLNRVNAQCTRLQVVGNTLYRSQSQTINNCPMMDNTQPNCNSDGGLLWEQYTRSSALSVSPKVQTLFVTLIIAVIFAAIHL